jgi:hypothetical protein
VSRCRIEIQEEPLMARETQFRPDLHDPTLKLIEEVWSAHQKPDGEITLIDVVKLFAPDLDAEDEARIRSRGTVRFHATSATEGEFRNEGAEVRVKKGIATITVPRVVAGTYRATEEAFALVFDPAHTVSGRALLFNVKLENISATQTEIVVDMSGGNFDQHIIHKR